MLGPKSKHHKLRPSGEAAAATPPSVVPEWSLRLVHFPASKCIAEAIRGRKRMCQDADEEAKPSSKDYLAVACQLGPLPLKREIFLSFATTPRKEPITVVKPP